MVISINDSFSKYPGLTAAGAYDAERKWWFFDPDGDGISTADPQPTLDWARGYNSVIGRLPYYLFGSMDGAIRDSSWEGRTNQLFDIYYELSTGLGAARPLPITYSWAFAKEWYQLKRYTVATRKPIDMRINGVLTSYRNDQDTNFATWPEFDIGSFFLTPNAGWQAMYDALNRTVVKDYTLRSDLVSKDRLRVAPRTSITFLATQYCAQTDAIFAQNTLIPSRTCFPADTIVPENTTLTQSFAFPSNERIEFNSITAQYLSWSSNMTYGYVPPAKLK